MSSINNKPPTPAPPIATPAPQQQQPVNGENPLLRPSARPSTTGETHQAEKLLEQVIQPPPRKQSADEVERYAAQVGYVRTQKRKRHGFEMDDMSQAPIPLPIDDVDESGWEQKTLDEAQEELTLQSSELQHLANDVEQNHIENLGFVAKLVERAFKPTPEDIARLQALQQSGTPDESIGLGAVNNSMQSLFGINIQHVPQGPALVAAALVVAGLHESVQATADSLEPGRFCRGMQTLVSRSNEAVDDARGMSQGITKQLAIQRTFMFRR